MNNVVLLGDSVFDNAVYVGGGPDVRAQLGERLPEGWQATLLAVDGSITRDVPDQLRRLPTGATHLIVSTGGNDALHELQMLTQPATTVSEALYALGSMAAQFRESYRHMLAEVLSRQLPTVACTIYYPAFEDPAFQRTAAAGLAFFNETILAEAARNRIPVLDLRLIFTDPGDYANPIEPSVAGGAKLADAICRLVLEHDFDDPYTRVYF